jgi:hypothetical protein
VGDTHEKPTVGMWGEGFMEDPNIANYNVTAKNESAVHQLHSNTNKAININAKTALKKKMAIFQFFQNIPSLTIEKLLQLDDEESKYSKFREINGIKHHEQFAIIFSGAYNSGVSCIPEALTPYTLTVENNDYTATAKENWRKHFPNIVMMQRNSKIDKSIYERFLIGKARHSTSSASSSTSSSSSNSLMTPKSTKGTASHYSSPSTNNDSHRHDSFESFMSVNEPNKEKSKTEKNTEEMNNILINEYVMNDNSNRSGITKIVMKDNSVMDLEFNMDGTIENPRIFKGNNGTHRWMAYKELIVPNKLKILVGDYVVVLGITSKRKIHIEDPTYYTTDDTSGDMRTFSVDSNIFAKVDIHRLSPESI